MLHSCVTVNLRYILENDSVCIYAIALVLFKMANGTYVTRLGTEYEPGEKRSWLKRLAGVSIQDEFCDHIQENKNWPFDDFGTFLEFTYTSKTYSRAVLVSFII